jgi:hypothetical protein
MAVYASATWEQGNSGGSYLGGPWRIVWHTTEVTTAAEAIKLFRQRNSWPHFTVDETTVWQHVDTDVAARALENWKGGVETNRWHAVQIELVAQAAKEKPPALLARAATLSRWIESTHGIPRTWPAGWPAMSANDCRRDATVWRTKGGHYGHCHVPENRHWDPGIINLFALMGSDAFPGDFPEPSGRDRMA